MSKTTRGLNQNCRHTNKESKSEHLRCGADLVCEFLGLSERPLFHLNGFISNINNNNNNNNNNNK
jgi:hypothetical protein